MIRPKRSTNNQRWPRIFGSGPQFYRAATGVVWKCGIWQWLAQKFRQELTTTAQGAAVLRLSGISKYYGRIAALSDVSVAFQAGEVHAILGENGAGKSTLMNIIAGVIRPQIGEIEFDGRAVANMSPETAASHGVAISYQHPAILDDLSVLENLRVVAACCLV